MSVVTSLQLRPSAPARDVLELFRVVEGVVLVANASKCAMGYSFLTSTIVFIALPAMAVVVPVLVFAGIYCGKTLVYRCRRRWCSHGAMVHQDESPTHSTGPRGSPTSVASASPTTTDFFQGQGVPDPYRARVASDAGSFILFDSPHSPVVSDSVIKPRSAQQSHDGRLLLPNSALAAAMAPHEHTNAVPPSLELPTAAMDSGKGAGAASGGIRARPRSATATMPFSPESTIGWRLTRILRRPQWSHYTHFLITTIVAALFLFLSPVTRNTLLLFDLYHVPITIGDTQVNASFPHMIFN